MVRFVSAATTSIRLWAGSGQDHQREGHEDLWGGGNNLLSEATFSSACSCESAPIFRAGYEMRVLHMLDFPMVADVSKRRVLQTSVSILMDTRGFSAILTILSVKHCNVHRRQHTLEFGSLSHQSKSFLSI